jgi:hypothetical protein
MRDERNEDGRRASEELGRVLRARRNAGRPVVNLDPATAYEVVTRQMVEDLARELTAVRQRIDSIFYLIAGALAVNVIMRLVGA